VSSSPGIIIRHVRDSTINICLNITNLSEKNSGEDKQPLTCKSPYGHILSIIAIITAGGRRTANSGGSAEIGHRLKTRSTYGLDYLAVSVSAQ
jgi:hypothetical protein